MTASELTELAARVEAGSGEDKDLRVELALALGYDISWRQHNYTMESYPVIYWKGTREPCPAWETSLDAVVALIAERLPGWGVNIYCGWQWDKATARLAMPSALRAPDDSNARPTVSASSAPRALLSSLLRALAAQQQDRPTEGE